MSKYHHTAYTDKLYFFSSGPRVDESILTVNRPGWPPAVFE